ncbi:nicotinamide mononucleotide adenylyl transferase [Peziza echinospora]|nr:nicotinamide mononucleotide adenylyl transferase [Peziza echinospora]
MSLTAPAAAGDSQVDTITPLPPNPPEPSYQFPISRLRRTISDPEKTPLVLVACGSFSPITYMHLRMFEMAMDHARSHGFEVIGGYISPVGDAYSKRGLVSATHRIHMCTIAAEQTSNWIMVDPWEGMNTQYTPTAMVLDHFEDEINVKMGGVQLPNGETRKVRISLLAGSDLISTMGEPGVWNPRHLEHILGGYGAFIIERSGSKADKAVEFIPQQFHRNIHIIRQLIANDVSSTKIRDLLSQRMSVHYLLPNCVIEYICEQDLYRPEARPAPIPRQSTAQASASQDTAAQSSSGTDQSQSKGTKRWGRLKWNLMQSL